MKKIRDHGRTVTLLVWTLVAIGLLAGAVTNALVGWTLLTLNRERLQMLDQDRRLGELADRVQRLGQEARGEVSALLQGESVADDSLRLAEFSRLLGELQRSMTDPAAARALAGVAEAAGELTSLRRRAADWLERSREVNGDLEEKRTLGAARRILENLRAAAEMMEGRQRLQEAILLRRWREASVAGKNALAKTILEEQAQNRSRIPNEIRTELAELSRLVETLAGEAQLDDLADLRDNQLKPVLERLEGQLAALAGAPEVDSNLTPVAIAELRDVLFGRGHLVIQEYQTIRIGRGGLFRLARDALNLRREREELQARAQQLFERIEVIHPVLAGLAGVRSQSLTRHAEDSLGRGLHKLLLASLVFLGGFLGLGLLISRKVEHQVLTLNQLRRQNELILNSAGEGIVGLDRSGRTTFINPAGARLLGDEPDELTGRRHQEILCRSHPDNEACSLEASPIATVLETGVTRHDDDQVFWRQDGSRFPVEYTATPICNEKGEIEGAVVTLLDISDRREAEAALQHSYRELERHERELDRLNRSLEEKVAERTRELEVKHHQLIRAQEDLARQEQLAAVGSLAAGVAHEINNPTAIIRGNAEILRRKLAKDGPGVEEAREILKHTDRISRIVGNLLIFSRKQAINPEAVQVNSLLGEILNQVPHQIQFHRVQVFPIFDPDLPPLWGDREKLRQVFTNLILNAVQAMGEEGLLTVGTRQSQGMIEVHVQDSGPGISDENKGKIFNPFFTTKKSGTGLGLSVSYGIVQALGGSLEVESEPGQGALFLVRLPLGELPPAGETG